MRIIGVELRVRMGNRYGNQQTEIAIIPCDVSVVAEPTGGNYLCPVMNGTLHTDMGDITIPEFQVQEYYFADRKTGLQFKQRS